MIRIKIRALKGLCLFVMRLHIEGGVSVESLALYTFVSKNAISESDISAVNFIVSW